MNDVTEAHSLDQECDRIVAKMTAMGANFQITRTGNDEPRWVYASQIIERPALRQFWHAQDSTRIGFHAAFVRAIMRTKFVCAP